MFYLYLNLYYRNIIAEDPDYDSLQVTHNAFPVTPLTIGGTGLKESDDLDILGVTFDSKMTFEKHLRSVSRAASQRLGILRKSWWLFHDRSLLERCFGVLCCQFWSTVLQCRARLQIHTLNYWTVISQWCPFPNCGCDRVWHCSSSICSVLCMLYKIRCHPKHPLHGDLPGPHVPVRVTRDALVAHRHTYLIPRYRTSQYRKTFIIFYLSVLVERSCWLRIRCCRTGGFQEQDQCFFIALSWSIPFCVLLFFRFSFLCL